MLRRAPFRRLLAAHLLSLLGSQVARVALILHVFGELGSIRNVALLVAVETVPSIVLAPAAGVVIDRRGTRSVMVASDLVRAVLLFAIALEPTLDVIFAMVVLHSAAGVFFRPAQAAAIPAVVARDEVVRANGADQIATNAAIVCGPLLGVYLYTWLGLASTLVFDAVSFVVSALLVCRIAAGGARPRRRSPARDLRAGWGYLMRDHMVLHVALLFMAGLTCAGVWVPLAPAFLRDFVHGPDEILGWQLTAFGVGGIAGATCATALSRGLGKGALLVAALGAEALCMVVYSWVSDVRGSLIVICGWGIAVSMGIVAFRSVLQSVVSGRFLGRVFSAVEQGEQIALLMAMALAFVLQQVLASEHAIRVAGLAYAGVLALALSTRRGQALLRMR